jgi:hypothetical protein
MHPTTTPVHINLVEHLIPSSEVMKESSICFIGKTEKEGGCGIFRH